MVAERNPQIAKAAVILRQLSGDELARDLYDRRERELRDERARIHGARNEGRVEGRIESAREIARNFLKHLDVEIVARETGLSLQEVIAIKEEKPQK